VDRRADLDLSLLFRRLDRELLIESYRAGDLGQVYPIAARRR
jgi:hypothetical protein